MSGEEKLVHREVRRQRWLLALGLGLILLLLITAWLLSQRQPKSPTPSTNETSNLWPDRRAGIELRQSENAPLPLKFELDQDRYGVAIEQAWYEARLLPASRVLGFEGDPNLVAFVYRSPGQEMAPLVVYTNQPIIVQTIPVDGLPERAPASIELASDNYQLLIRYQYTPQIKELDLPQLLLDGFALITGEQASAPSANPDTDWARALEALRF